MPSTTKNDGIFCDLHNVNHKILLAKLQFYGITVKFLSLIKSYLEDRYQKCNLASVRSSSLGLGIKKIGR